MEEICINVAAWEGNIKFSSSSVYFLYTFQSQEVQVLTAVSAKKVWSIDFCRFIRTEMPEEYFQKNVDVLCCSGASSAMQNRKDEWGEPVGFLCMTKADYEKNSIHFCYIIVSSRSRGKGYGTQMLQFAVQYAVELLQMQRITLRVFENNQAARRCYQKVGFREEAYYPMAMEYKGARWSAYDMVYQVQEASPASSCCIW